MLEGVWECIVWQHSSAAPHWVTQLWQQPSSRTEEKALVSNSLSFCEQCCSFKAYLIPAFHLDPFGQLLI